MTWADYDFYSSDYLGEAEQADFLRLAPRAAAELERLTLGRTETAAGPVLEAVKLAQCAMVDELLYQERGGAVLEETNDGISRRYAAPDTRTLGQRLLSAADTYLWDTGLMSVCC